MKPKNMPGRKLARKVRADARAREWLPGLTVTDEPLPPDTHYGKGARANAHPTVADTCWRLGAKNRDAFTGIGRTVVES